MENGKNAVAPGCYVRWRTAPLAVLALLMGAAVNCSARTTISLSPLSAAGGTKYLEELRVTSDDEIVAMQVDIRFDPAAISIDSVVKGSASPRHTLSHRQISPGLLRAVLTSTTNAEFVDGALLAINFDSPVVLDRGARVFSLSNVEFSTRRAFGVSASLAPYVEITAPVDGSDLPAAQTVAVTAITVANEGNIDRVEFFADGLRIGVASAEPYSVSFFPTALGPAFITAVAITDLGASATDQIEVEITGDPYYQAWRTANFTPAQLADELLSGPTGDPEKDKVPNLVEYYLGLNPNLADGVAKRLEFGLIEVEGERYLALTLRKPVAVNDLSAKVVSSPDLGFAEAGQVLLHERRIEGDDEVLVYRDTVPTTNARERFLRAAFDFSP